MEYLGTKTNEVLIPVTTRMYPEKTVLTERNREKRSHAL